MKNLPRNLFFAIRHTPSGGFLPQMASYGMTRCEPSLEEPPRLFRTKKGANQSLGRWLQGEWYEGLDNEETGEMKVRIIPRSNRRAADMEIVEIEILWRTLTQAELRML